MKIKKTLFIVSFISLLVILIAVVNFLLGTNVGQRSLNRAFFSQDAIYKAINLNTLINDFSLNYKDGANILQWKKDYIEISDLINKNFKDPIYKISVEKINKDIYEYFKPVRWNGLEGGQTMMCVFDARE